MKTIRPFLLTAALAALTLLTACSVSLAQDVTPPPDYVPPVTQQTQTPVQIVLPMVPPDPDAGAPIFNESCEPCHGPAGKGDGSMANNLSSPPPSIGAVENIRAAQPVEWYRMVTQGNMQNMMPGFAGSLTDRQRWDVVAYVFSFGMTSEQLEKGEALYSANCQDCHGEGGVGNGQTADWTDPARLAQRSDVELRQVFASGEGDHPSFAESLDENQQWAVTSYIRSLSFAGSWAAGQLPAAQATPAVAAETPAGGTPQAAATPEAGGTTPAQSAGNITGRVVNASGSPLPESMTVTLVGFDSMVQSMEVTTTTMPDGNFIFENVELLPDRVYVAMADWQGITFNSDMLRGSDVLAGQEARVNVHVYDTTTDTSGLVAERMHVFFDFPSPGVVQVGELFIVSNPGNLMVTGENPGGAVVSYTLPEGATNLTFQDGELGGRFLQTENGFADTASISPGSGMQVLFAYELPYDGDLDVTLTPPLPVSAAVIIVPENGARLSSSQLTDTGARDMQGVSVHLYTASSLPAGQPLEINVSGNAGATAALDSGTTTGLIVGGLSLAVSLGLTIYYFTSRRKRLLEEVEDEEEEDGPEDPDDLVEAIVALDDLYQSGQLPQEAYDERRAALKEKLRVAMENGESNGK